MSHSFAAAAAALVEQVRGARARGRRGDADRALRELLTLYARLGERELGTVEEQNQYIVARHLGHLPANLQDLGVRLEDLPEPPGRRSPLPPAAAVERVAEHLARVGAPGSASQARFVLDFRPQDDKRFQGRLCPWAVVDTADGLPVAWYYDQAFAELSTDEANRLRGAA